MMPVDDDDDDSKDLGLTFFRIAEQWRNICTSLGAARSTEHPSTKMLRYQAVKEEELHKIIYFKEFDRFDSSNIK